MNGYMIVLHPIYRIVSICINNKNMKDPVITGAEQVIPQRMI